MTRHEPLQLGQGMPGACSPSRLRTWLDLRRCRLTRVERPTTLRGQAGAHTTIGTWCSLAGEPRRSTVGRRPGRARSSSWRGCGTAASPAAASQPP